MELRVCVLCGEERPVERPECLDGHGADCPEAFCADCGSALLVGPTPSPAGAVPMRARGSRRPPRRPAGASAPGRRAS